MRTDAIQSWSVSGIIHLNKVFAVCSLSLACLLASTAFSIELDATRNPPELSTIKELGSQFKQVIKQTHTQYADDGRIVGWDETYIYPLEASVLKYNFRTFATNHLEPAGSLAILQNVICFKVGSKWLPRNPLSVNAWKNLDENLQSITIQEFARPRLEFAAKLAEKASGSIKSNSVFLKKADSLKQAFDLDVILKSGKLDFTDGPSHFVASISDSGLIRDLKYFASEKLRIEYTNEQVPGFSFGSPLSPYLNESGRIVYYDPSTVYKGVFGSPSLGILYTKRDKDYVVVGVASGSPADKAGITVGQHVLTINGHDVNTLDDSAFTSLATASDPCTIELENSTGKRLTFTLQNSSPDTW